MDSQPETPPYYSVPPDNPFVDDPAFLDEIWALGLRNPWRFFWDPVTLDLWITDVGHHTREEINFLPAGSPGGQNYGFKMMEGFFCRGRTDGCTVPIPPCFDPAYTLPALDYGLDDRHCAIIGGPVYRGTAIPEMQGAMVAADYCGASFLVHHHPDGTFELEELSKDVDRVVAFGEDLNREVYALSRGAVYRIHRLVNDTAVAFDQAEWTVDEAGGPVTVSVSRSGDLSGAASADYSASPFSASEADFVPASGTFTWAAGEGGTKTFTVQIVDDAEQEGVERVLLELSNGVGVELGEPSRAELVIEDDDVGGGPCAASDTILCLGADRFRVTATWRNFDNEVGVGNAVSLLPLGEQLASSGLLWFFTDDNMEILVKVLDACAINGHHWVFFSAATDVEYRLQVLDTRTGVLREYPNPLGTASPATTDVSAFVCP